MGWEERGYLAGNITYGRHSWAFIFAGFLISIWRFGTTAMTTRPEEREVWYLSHARKGNVCIIMR